MLDKVKEWEREETSASQSEIQNLSDKIKASEARMEKLVSAYLDGDIPKEIYLKQKDKTMRATLALQTEMKDFERGRKNWVEPLRSWILDTKQADFLSSSDNFSEISSFVKKVGTNHAVRDKTTHFSVPSPSAFVAMVRESGRLPNHFLPHCAPSARRPSSLSRAEVSFGGEGGIRTLEGVSPLAVFKTAAFNHSSHLSII
jgi:hypothetical protein